MFDPRGIPSRGMRGKRHVALISWLKRGHTPACADVAIRIAGCRVGTVKKGSVSIFTTGTSIDHIGNTIACDKHLCDLCGTEKARKLRRRNLSLVKSNWPQGVHIHFIPTIKHAVDDQWASLISVFTYAWSGVTRTRWWKKEVLGFIRNDNTTHDTNGFHVHQHNIITLRHDTDLVAFFKKLKSYYSNKASEFSYSMDWSNHEGWRQKVKDENGLANLIKYIHKSVEWETFKDGEGTWARTGQMAYAEVWQSCRGHRWHASGGIWKSQKPEVFTLDAKQNPGRTIPASIWARLGLEGRAKLMDCLGTDEGVAMLESLLEEADHKCTPKPGSGRKNRSKKN